MFFAFMGIMTSVKSALPVTSWNSRLKSPSSKESGTTTLSHRGERHLGQHARREVVGVHEHGVEFRR